jgi:hypothetical protein
LISFLFSSSFLFYSSGKSIPRFQNQHKRGDTPPLRSDTSSEPMSSHFLYSSFKPVGYTFHERFKTVYKIDNLGFAVTVKKEANAWILTRG